MSRSDTIGLRLCGIADEPFWPDRNGSWTSPSSVCWRLRTSTAKRSIEPPVTAIAARNAAWRSRWTICVLTGSAASPSSASASASTSGGRCEYVPTGPESFPVARSAEAAAQARAIAVELERPGRELEPERDRLGVDAVRASHLERAGVLSGASDEDLDEAVERSEDEVRGRAALERECRVHDVAARQAEVEVAALLPDRLGDL